MAVNKTLYVRDEDAPVWERARELADEKLSAFLTKYLRDFVQGEEAKAAGFERILLRFREHGRLPQSIAFHGKWLIAPNENWQADGPTDAPAHAVALTAKKKVLVFSFFRDSPDGPFTSGHYVVFNSFEDASWKAPQDVIATAMERMGIEVQELDI